MRLRVDMPRPAGGSTNDGNTARGAYSQEELLAEITNVDQDLIHRFAVILQTLASGHSISVSRFEDYCSATAELYVSLYMWYHMPVSLHKVLIHGAGYRIPPTSSRND